jgi:hypothetical protein
LEYRFEQNQTKQDKIRIRQNRECSIFQMKVQERGLKTVKSKQINKSLDMKEGKTNQCPKVELSQEWLEV